MQYDYKSLGLVLTEAILQRRIIGDEAAIAPGLPAMLLWPWPSAIRELSSTGSLVIATHYLGPSLFTRLASRRLSAVFRIGALPSREMFRAFPTGSSCSQKGLSSAVWCIWQQRWTSWSFPAGCCRFSTHLTRCILGYVKKKSGSLIGILCKCSFTY